MDTAVLYSGGKDSNYALYWALNQGWDVQCLVSMLPQRDDSYMFHVPCVNLTGLQAECIGIPIVSKTVSGVKEKEVAELEQVLKGLRVEGVVSGAVASEYQKTRIDSVCHKLGFKSFAPLWHKRPISLVSDILSAGFEVVVSGVSAYGLDESWLGKTLCDEDLETLMELERKYGVSVCGEGGEFETLVVDGPIFNERIEVVRTHKVWGGQAGQLIVDEARTVRKKSV